MNNVRSDVGRLVGPPLQQRLFRPLFCGAVLSGLWSDRGHRHSGDMHDDDDGRRGDGDQDGSRQGRRCGTKSGIRGMILRCPVRAGGEEAKARREDGIRYTRLPIRNPRSDGIRRKGD